MEDIRVIFECMPPSIKGLVVKTFDDDEFYTVVINSNLSYEERLRTYEHEVRHVRARDFEAEGASVDEIEQIGHL